MGSDMPFPIGDLAPTKVVAEAGFSARADRQHQRWPGRQAVRIKGESAVSRAELRPVESGADRKYRDLHEHLEALRQRGLLLTIDRPIDKDAELHRARALAVRGRARRGAIGRRSCSPTSSTARGRKYAMPVVVGAIAANRAIYSVGMGAAARGDPGEVGPRHRESDPARASSTTGRLSGGRPGGRGAAGGRQRARSPAHSDLDARLRQRADADRDQRDHARPRDRRAEHGHLSRRAEGARPARGAHGHARRRRGRLPALPAAPEARRQDDAVRHRARLPAVCRVHGAAEAADRRRRARRRGRACRRAHQRRQGAHRRPARARRSRDRDRGLDRHGVRRARGAVRRDRTATSRWRNTTCRCA